MNKILVLSLLWSLSLVLNAAEGPDNGVFSGIYQGSFFGDDNGTLSLEIDNKGQLLWEGESIELGAFVLRGAVEFHDGRWMLRGSTNNGLSFQGYLEDDGSFSGNWEYPFNGRHGSFDLHRLRQ